MAYTFRYQILSPAIARTDGSGAIQHEIEAMVSSDGVNYTTVPGRHKSVCIPANQVQNALSVGTNNQKIAAYKTILVNNLNFQPDSLMGWDLTSLAALMFANDAAQVATDLFNNFITVTLNKQFPVPFSL